MNNFRKKLPGTPYFFWSVLFIIIPLCMVFYYGLTDKSGAFTLENIIAVTTREHSKALWLSLLLSLIATVICLLLSFLPFMVLPIYNALAKIDENVINAARDLGASPVQVFFKVMLPLTLPGIISGITMVFIPALTTFVISNLLGGSKVLLIGNVVEQEFTQASNWHLGSGLSIVLMLFILLNMIVSAIFDKEGEGSVL